MSKLFQSFKKVVGCSKNSKREDTDSLITNDLPEKNIDDNTMAIPIHNYDKLRDSTNSQANKRAKSSNKASYVEDSPGSKTQKFNYSHLNHESRYNQDPFKNKKCSKLDENNNILNKTNSLDDSNYYHTIEQTNDKDPLIMDAPLEEENNFFDSKNNLFAKFDVENHQNNDENNLGQNIEKSQSLTEIRDLNSFNNQSEAFDWYLSTLFDTMIKCIKTSQVLNETDKSKRVDICTAHLLYARNFYDMRVSGSSNLKQLLANVHPCLISLACLIDSDAVRIVESHSCACDTYVYMFATRLKFCAWKSKLYIILKKPKRSSIERLALIEDLNKCFKLIQDKKFN